MGILPLPLNLYKRQLSYLDRSEIKELTEDRKLNKSYTQKIIYQMKKILKH